MKSVLLVALFGVLITFSYAAKSSKSSANTDNDSASAPETRADVVRGQERGDHHGGGGHGGHGAHSEGHGHTVYHETHGQELFQGEEWMLLIPLILIPLLILGCWYMWGGKGGDEGWGWDRMGYSDNSVGGAYSNQGSYDTRSFVPADTIDKATHQRIMNSIQQ